ncbi:MAG: flagellar hook-basal body complex protein [Planctomycetaceae bacterium]|nr:flagellar hook-basal body complex protein [Planctomycetaceae bacterium]
MALMQALSTGINGLNPHQKAMDNIGNNLANVNTVGFKKGAFQFSTLLEQSLRGGIGPDAGTGRGSINPISMGSGAQTASINKVFTQGPIENTGNPNDMAIDGNGFFVLRTCNGFAYTRAGSFYRGEDGSLMAGDGLYVQGTMARKNGDGSISIPQDAQMENIVIPIGSTGGHTQTTQVKFTGNLDSRQELSNGTGLFGGTAYPSVSSLQAWMNKDFNGGNPITDKTVDTSWEALEKSTYAVSRDSWDKWQTAYGVTTSAPNDLTVYAPGMITESALGDNFSLAVGEGDETTAVYYAYRFYNTDANDPNAGYWGIEKLADPTSTDPAQRTPMTIAELKTQADPNGLGIKRIPIVQEIKTVNGGNVQTSAAYGIKVPGFLPATALTSTNEAIGNDCTYPAWFYESTGSSLGFDDIVARNRIIADPNSDPADVNQAIREIWPNGVDGSGWPEGRVLTRASLPYVNDTYPASLDTPLENIWYLKGNVWVQPFNNIKNGDAVSLSFRKGDSKVEAEFVYNRPVGPEPTNGQTAVGREQSYTLEHFLKFMAGDVDEPTVACQNITPAMFGAVVDDDYPYGNPSSPSFDKLAYDEALKNVSLATSDTNMDSVGGAMGLLSIPPHVSDKNYGSDSYDTPAESAGAYSRSGVQTVRYDRWDPEKQQYVKDDRPSFNVSIVSNLGDQNAISDISISYKNVSHEAMFNAESDYSEPQGGSAVVTMDFYDSLGNPKTATLRLAKVSQDSDFTTWRWYADCPDDSDAGWQTDPNTNEIISNLNVGTGLIRFDKNGNYVKGADYSETDGITINQSGQGVNEPIIISLINSLSSRSTQELDFSTLTCSATSNSFKLYSQNGRPPGTLNDFTVSLDGVIRGVYSNGNTVEIARIGLAMIPNENGLIAAGTNLFYTGPASGDARYGHANSGGNGQIRHMQLESSNVDLSEEFTKMISIERGFQANSRIITTADEMIQELLSLKR